MSGTHVSLFQFDCLRSLPTRSLLLLLCVLLSSRNIDSIAASSGLGGGVSNPTTVNKNPSHTSRGRASSSQGMARNIEEENGPPVLSESIMGTIGHLPCNVTPPIHEDRVALVIWYKVGLKTPIYSVDTRDSNFTQGTHWSDETYRDRLTFNVKGRVGTLAIKTTAEEDTGEYRCRVDFQKSPTRNSKVNLTVITPPESIIILDSRGATIKDNMLGPYNEGSMVNITCVAIGGRPQPKVTWWRDNKPLHSSNQPLSDRRVANVLSLGKLERKNLHMQLTCQAANNNLTVPIISTVTLDMNLRPLIVKLQGENRPLSAENSYQLNCLVIGSRPAPTVTWWKGSTPMKNTHEINNPDGNSTTSILTFTPTIDDRGKFMSCRAEQSMIPESGVEDGWKLDIFHIPVITLELGTNSINSTLREGIDVFFECNIKSNPWIYQVSWRHNGNILENNIAEGIIVANQSLVLQNISRARSGIYTCVGSNREGDGESNPVQLEIKFAPVCRVGQRTAYSSGRHETVKIACEIEANPTDTSYIWKFNATQGELVDIPASLVAIDRGRSVAHYTPMTENDYGTLLCWASNEIGDQSEPCIYTISPAGEPDPLANCTLLNQTSTGFQIECVEGFDGGLQQDFIMEVYVNGTTRHPRIFSSKTPYFEVRGLVPGIGYNVFLVAHNKKGRSNATILQVYTLKDPEKQTVTISYTNTFQPRLGNAIPTRQSTFSSTLPTISPLTSTEAVDCLTTIATVSIQNQNLSLAYVPVIEDIRPFLVILAGIVISLFFVSILIVIVVRLRGSAGHDRNNYSHPANSGAGIGNNNNVNHGINASGLLTHNGAPSAHEGSIHRVARDGNCHVASSLDSIDKNPDIIPQDGRDDDDEWTTKGHNRAYATAALAEQNAVISSTTYDHIMPTYAVVDKNSQQAHLQQLPNQQPHSQYIQYNTLIPVGKMSAYATSQQHQQHHHQQQQQNKTDLSYPEISTSLIASASGTSVQRMSPYCSATLGRPRQTELKRAEPNIYSQIDLAHHPMYSTSPLFGANVSTGSSVGVSSNATITGVTMSHPSQLATFAAPPPLFASHHNVVTATHAAVAAAASNNVLLPSRGSVCMTLPPVTLHAVQTSTGASAAVATQQQHIQPSLSVATDECSSAGSGAGNGSIVGVGMSVYGDVNAKSSMLKAVPEELHFPLDGEDEQISQERNNATRF